MDRKVVYVSGAYRNPDLGTKLYNILEAWRAAERIWEAGHIAICPHANTILMNESKGATNVDFVGGDLVIIERCCDALFMLSNWETSTGANIEHRHARSKDIPVFYSWGGLTEWLKNGKAGRHDGGADEDCARLYDEGFGGA